MHNMGLSPILLYPLSSDACDVTVRAIALTFPVIFSRSNFSVVSSRRAYIVGESGIWGGSDACSTALFIVPPNSQITLNLVWATAKSTDLVTTYVLSAHYGVDPLGRSVAVVRQSFRTLRIGRTTIGVVIMI